MHVAMMQLLARSRKQAKEKATRVAGGRPNLEVQSNRQPHPSHRKATKEEGHLDLESLDVQGVCSLMERLQLQYCIKAIRREGVDGSELAEYRSEEEFITFLSRYGIYLIAVQEFKSESISTSWG